MLETWHYYYIHTVNTLFVVITGIIGPEFGHKIAAKMSLVKI